MSTQQTGKPGSVWWHDLQVRPHSQAVLGWLDLQVHGTLHLALRGHRESVTAPGLLLANVLPTSEKLELPELVLLHLRFSNSFSERRLH